jgi:hypothetical protein
MMDEGLRPLSNVPRPKTFTIFASRVVSRP